MFANVPNESQVGPKFVRNCPQMCPTGLRKGYPECLRILKMALGALGAFLAIFVRGFVVLLGRFGCHFGGQWDPDGVPKSSFWGQNRHKRLQNVVPEGDPDNFRKLRGNRVPK